MDAHGGRENEMSVTDSIQMAGYPERVLLPRMRRRTGTSARTFYDAWFDKGIVGPMFLPEVTPSVDLPWALRWRRRVT